MSQIALNERNIHQIEYALLRDIAAADQVIVNNDLNIELCQNALDRRRIDTLDRTVAVGISLQIGISYLKADAF